MRKLLILSAALGALSVASAANAVTYSTTFQGATFTVNQVSSNEFTFDIGGANALTGDWTGAAYLGAFAFKGIGSLGAHTVTAVLIDPNTGQSTTDTAGGLNANGCNGAGTDFYCFNLSPNVAVANHLKFDITVAGANFTFAPAGPELKIDWTASSTSDTHIGSLFSAAIPAGPGVPEPASWALMILGFGGVGSVLRSRRRNQAALTA